MSSGRKISLGAVGLIMGFDPLERFPEGDPRAGTYKFLWFARELRDRSRLYTRFSLPIVASADKRKEYVELVTGIKQLGFKHITGIFMFADMDPGLPSLEDDAVESMRNAFAACVAAGISEVMGPSGFRWGDGADQEPLKGAALASHLRQTARVHIRALNSLPQGHGIELFSTEHLFGAEGNKVTTGYVSSQLADMINAGNMSSVKVGVALDTAHTYVRWSKRADAKHELADIESLNAEIRYVSDCGNLTLNHVSAPLDRAHPLKSDMPLRGHVLFTAMLGCLNFDVECFDYRLPWLQKALRGIGSQENMNLDDPCQVFVETANQLNEWFKSKDFELNTVQ